MLNDGKISLTGEEVGEGEEDNYRTRMHSGTGAGSSFIAGTGSILPRTAAAAAAAAVNHQNHPTTHYITHQNRKIQTC